MKSLGRSFERHGAMRHIIEPHTDDKTQEIQEFTREVIQYLEDLFTKKTYSKLIIAAPPKVLGMLRKKLSKDLKQHIILELDKDLIQSSVVQIEAHLKN
ncbi:MAG: host attachment protein [Candidatus Midichloria sp.]|nr:host attachment protein [Candidatus Midichloria sp.]